MTNDADILMVGGNWTYVTLQDMEGKWTAGQIWVLGSTWIVNEESGAKSIYSSGTQSIIFGYAGGKQTILWDNPETYIDNEDGSYNTERRFNLIMNTESFQFMNLQQKTTGSDHGGGLMTNRITRFIAKAGKSVTAYISLPVTIQNPLRI